LINLTGKFHWKNSLPNCINNNNDDFKFKGDDVIIEIVKLIRPHHYIKNLFVLAPIFFSGLITNEVLLNQSLIAFILFSLAASSVYILNDIMDVSEDRLHPKKKNRPIASGSVPVSIAWVILTCFVVASLVGSWYISANLTYVLILYIVMNILYSLGMKHLSIIDVTMISIGFVLRIFAGSVIIETPPSMWIILMTFFLSFFLGLSKRRDDVLMNANGLKVRRNIDGYNLDFVNAAMVVMASVVIFSYISYTIADSVQERLDTDYLYLTVLFVIVGIFRYFQITFVEENSGSPTKIMISDRFSQINIAIWLITFSYIIY
jgi:4-hydroxybenzoate polyprenyltransferase